MKFGTLGPLDLQIDFGHFHVHRKSNMVAILNFCQKFVQTTPPKPKVRNGVFTIGFGLLCLVPILQLEVSRRHLKWLLIRHTYKVFPAIILKWSELFFQ